MATTTRTHTLIQVSDVFLRIDDGTGTKLIFPAALAYHYAQLQALAFEEDFDPSDPDKIAELDKTFPKHGGMHKIAGKYMEAWNGAIRDDERAIESLKGGTKRTIHKVQVEADDLEDIESAYRDNTLDKVSERNSSGGVGSSG